MIISDEYGVKNGPYPDTRKDFGKVVWYTPHDHMHPNYRIGEELDPDFVMPRDEYFKIDYFDDKRAVYFQRIKKSNFLPRCIRENLTTKNYLHLDLIKCHSWDQEPVNDDFYKILGIEKNKNYIFEFVSVW